MHAGRQEAESWRLDDTVEKEIDKLKIDYAAIAIEACECLENHKPSLSAVYRAVWLNDRLRGSQDEPLIVAEGVSTYSDLFAKLQKKWSFTNPDLLKQLLQKLGNHSLLEKLDGYIKRFDFVCSTFPIDKPVRFEPYDESQPCLVLILSFETLDDLKVILKDVFDIYKRYLRVHMITPGNIKEVTIQFPTGMTKLVQECIDEKRRAANNASMRIQHTAAPKTDEEADDTGIEPKQTDTHTTELKTDKIAIEPSMSDTAVALDPQVNNIKEVIRPFKNQYKTEKPRSSLPSLRWMDENSEIKDFAIDQQS